MKIIPAAKDPTRNVWMQLGFRDAEEHFLKAELVLRLDKAIKSIGFAIVAFVPPAAARCVKAHRLMTDVLRQWLYMTDEMRKVYETE